VTLKRKKKRDNLDYFRILFLVQNALGKAFQDYHSFDELAA